MAKLIFLEDSYQKETHAKILEIRPKGTHFEIMLDQTVFYPEGGGQPSDAGTITGKKGEMTVVHCHMEQGNVVHEGKITGTIEQGEEVVAKIDWELRFDHMRWHSAGHIVHEAVMSVIPVLIPTKGEHGKHSYIEYRGTISPKLKERIQQETNLVVAKDLELKTEFVSFEELKKRAAWVPEKLPQNKPLRILQIEEYGAIPDGGTQVKNTAEVGHVMITLIEQLGEIVRVHYVITDQAENLYDTAPTSVVSPNNETITLNEFRSSLIDIQNELLNLADETNADNLLARKLEYIGNSGKATKLIKRLKDLPQTERKAAGLLVNEFKTSIDEFFRRQELQVSPTTSEWLDVSLPGTLPRPGHLHIVSQAIFEITDIFARIGFTRVRHPEVDWDYYAFEALNMPKDHPARDEWETFFITYPGKPGKDIRKQKMVLTPHTSNGQVREMEKGVLPIRMINIAKCYRRQSDVSHVPMFHQFEGLYVDKNVSIAHLKGVFDYFVKQFFGPDRVARLRPFHFQFTEPSFEIDITCGICLGKGCKLCKEGWLELGGAGMVHPNVLKAGGIDTNVYSGFAFGWGVERTMMMKSGTKLDDIRLLYSNDVRFLEQF